jgi:hypothetical protein
MKLIASNHRWFRQISKVLGCILLVLLCHACATFHEQYGSRIAKNFTDSTSTRIPKHTFYLVGDAGNSDKEKAKYGLLFLKSRLDRANKSSTLLFLGDNIYPNGMAAEGKADRAASEEKLNNQIVLAENFRGKTIFIPGNHDWYNGGLKGLKREADYITEKLGKKSFLPKNGCGIESVKIDDNTSLIIIDSQWYIENWDKNPNINGDCDIKSREAFFAELEDLINKGQNKTIFIAMHHPLVSNGIHGGQYSFKKLLFPFQSNVPLPVIGSAINFIRKTSGIDPQDLQNSRYRELTNRIKALVRGKENVVMVSGHEHNLEYVEKDDIRQIVSGAGSKSEAARAMLSNDFSYGGNGYAVLQLFDKGEMWVAFYGIKDQKEQLLYHYQVAKPKQEKPLADYPDTFPLTQTASIYDESLLRKSGFYNVLWGKHYRDLYGKTVVAKSVDLDTLYGGLKPVLAGGGHQSLSLRLEDPEGKPYVMRGLKKSATRFLQAVAFKDKSLDFRDTYVEDFLLDFYTTSHPYTPFATGALAENLGISHSNPKLFYVPKQTALGEFNASYGDALYMIEERPAKGFESLEDFGKPDAILSTEEVLANLHKDEKYKIDEKAYIRARLFDMLIGDWDRHHDQWRWGETQEENHIVYKPIPKDHDQAFCKYDGALLTLIMKMPPLRHQQSFEDDISNVKWFNREPYPLDLAVLRNATQSDWQAEADFIKNNLSDAQIETAFANLPSEVQDGTLEEIKRNLKSRREKLSRYANRYYEVLRKTVLIVGTDKKDKFKIERLGDGQTKVQVYRIKKDGDELISDHIYNRKETREIWIYGLDDDDVYEVSGSGDNPIKVRLIGGLNKDSYTVKEGRKVRIYDFKSKENEFNLSSGVRKVLTDKYGLNGYDYQKPKYNAVSGYPAIGYNPDDGIKVGVLVSYAVNGFQRNPFSQKHTVKANYYFATQGYELAYEGIFPNNRSNWQFHFDAQITSPNFSYNFFGYGNETENHDDDFDMDYNRVKTQTMRGAPSMHWKGDLGAYFSAQAFFESTEVEESENRFINTGIVDDRVFRTQNFTGLNLTYGFENYDNPANPTLGMKFAIGAGYTFNLNDTKRQVPQLDAALGFSHRVLTTEKLVFATLLKSKILFSDDFEFYQMATIGGDSDLRGFRKERFSGKQSFFQTSDLRFEIGKLKNGILPLNYGILGGFDYGRVWIDGEDSDKWHTSYGGGLWFSGIDTLTAKLSYFQSSDGGRFAFGLGFAF